ncbi:MAG: hypothetical protein NTU51_07205 [Bacteroidetes bacterium]|nr:hypothetical protein [Bacteroidota bacterium]
MTVKPAISFEQYLKRRGYLFLTFEDIFFKTIRKSFTQKSFCGFWRMWNPYSGYVFFLLYSLVRGDRKRPLAIFFIFITSGFVFHDLLIFLVTGSISIVFTVTFSIYSMIFNIEHRMLAIGKDVRSFASRKNLFPLKYHVMKNMALLALPLAAGFIINFYVFPHSVMSRLFH